MPTEPLLATRGGVFKAPIRTASEWQSHRAQARHWSAFDLLLLLFVVSFLIGAGFRCYLQLLPAAPDRPDSRYWAHLALVYSRNCGRTDEVLDALQHVIRFHPDLKAATRLKTLLDERSKDPAGFEVPNR